VPARASEADVTELLASQPVPAMPEHLVARVSDAIAAESARSSSSSRSGGRGDRQAPGASAPTSASVPTLPQPRSGKPWPLLEMIVPRPRKARSAA
jgi:hypothetical protein